MFWHFFALCISPHNTFRRAVSHSLMLSISVNYFRVSKDGERRLARRESGGREQAEAEQPAEDPAEEAGGARVAG